MGVYQILFMDKIQILLPLMLPLIFQSRKKAVKASGFINAVLRNLIRSQEHICWPDATERTVALLECPLFLPNMADTAFY